MNITKRKYQQAFNLCKQLAEQGLTIVKIKPDGKSTEDEIIVRGSAICSAAQEFIEDEDNIKHFKAIEKKIRQLGTKHALKDSTTKAILYEKNAQGNIIGYQNTQDEKDAYEDALEAFLDETIDFKDINVYICPKKDIVSPVPFELRHLNSLILNHSFWNKPAFNSDENLQQSSSEQ